jgi:spermidine/putrescine transport system permease protein
MYALITIVCCLLMACPLALLIARSPKKCRDLLILLVILPFWRNVLIRVYAWMILGSQSAPHASCQLRAGPGYN